MEIKNTAADSTQTSFFNFTVNSLDGQPVSFGQYRGKKVIVLNTASECGYTPQYADWEKFYAENKEAVVVLGFPCNDFGGQEPGGEAAINAFCTGNYKVTFPMFSKVAIKGADKHPLYAALQSTAGDVGWNFEKFLVGKDGRVLKHFTSDVEPDSPELMAAIEAALK